MTKKTSRYGKVHPCKLTVSYLDWNQLRITNQLPARLSSQYRIFDSILTSTSAYNVPIWGGPESLHHSGSRSSQVLGTSYSRASSDNFTFSSSCAPECYSRKFHCIFAAVWPHLQCIISLKHPSGQVLGPSHCDQTSPAPSLFFISMCSNSPLKTRKGKQKVRYVLESCPLKTCGKTSKAQLMVCIRNTKQGIPKVMKMCNPKGWQRRF